MAKKRKHYETCMHCAFIHAFKTKYGRFKVAKNNPKAFDEMVHSAIKIAALIMSKLDNQHKGQFMMDVLKRTAELEGLIAGVEIGENGFTVSVPKAPAEPTKH
jgi:hypothetical protein